MRTIDFVGYSPLPKELRGQRNVAPQDIANKDEGHFRSKAGRRGEDKEVPRFEYLHV